MTEVGNAAPGDKVEFSQFHQPSLKTGSYQITVTHQVATTELTDRPIEPTTFSTTRSFTVAGERFGLSPAEIYAVYPPDGSLSDHSNVLPHLMLSRSTLPWERQADPNDETLPWLALLLFTADETPLARVMTLADLQNSASAGVAFPAITLEAGQQSADRVTVIDVPADLLQAILPNPAALGFLAHVRQAVAADGQPTGADRAVLIGNRLPGPDQINTVFLVSLENRYTSAGFDFQHAVGAELVRLVTLQSWRFASPPEAQQSFTSLLLGLNHAPSTLRLQPNSDPLAEQYLAQGYTLVPHTMREANQSASWYHSPLGVGSHSDLLPLPAPAADQLVRYDAATGIFDVAYAAAWQLGRLMILRSKQISTNLYAWKRSQAQQQKEARLFRRNFGALKIQRRSLAASTFPADVAAWFEDLRLLNGVPFNYLLPDERMLPAESIRFFQLDAQWMACLLDGAFSVGRTTSGDLVQDQSAETNPALWPAPAVSGFVLRSAVVAGWPGLLVDGLDDEDQPLAALRVERLSDNVLLALFAGDIHQVRFHLQPETLHFGFDQPTLQYQELHKQLRDSAGAETELVIATLPWQDADRGVVAIDRLTNEMQQTLAQAPFTSAQFGLQMIEGVEEVIFERA